MSIELKKAQQDLREVIKQAHDAIDKAATVAYAAGVPRKYIAGAIRNGWRSSEKKTLNRMWREEQDKRFAEIDKIINDPLRQKPAKPAPSPINVEAIKQAREAQERAQRERVAERQAEMQMGLDIIKLGYKALAQKHHPDRVGGSREMMTKLNRARERLKPNV